MKKTIAVTVSIILAISLLAGCGNGNGNTTTTGQPSTTPSTSTTPEQTTTTLPATTTPPETTTTPATTTTPETTTTTPSTPPEPELPPIDYSDFGAFTENETMFEKTLVDDENVTIGLYAIGTGDGDPSYFLRIVNKTDMILGMAVKDGIFSVDGKEMPWKLTGVSSSVVPESADLDLDKIDLLRIPGNGVKDTALYWDLKDELAFQRGAGSLELLKNIEGTLVIYDVSRSDKLPLVCEYQFSDATGSNPRIS